MADIPVGKYMDARRYEEPAGWLILDKRGGVLGHVEWWARWRAYVFVPEANTIYSSGCARDIAAFLDARTAERKAHRA